MENDRENKSTTGALAAEGIAPTLDLIMDNLGWVPVLGAAVGAAKAVQEIKAGLDRQRQAAFLRGLGTHSPEDTKKFAAKLGSSVEERRRVGAAIFFALDKFTDFDKCELLGRLVLACAEGIITPTDLRRLADAMEKAFADDLQAFIDSDIEPQFSLEPNFFTHLELSGLTRNDGGYDGGTSEITALGKIMKNAMRAVDAKHPMTSKVS